MVQGVQRIRNGPTEFPMVQPNTHKFYWFYISHIITTLGRAIISTFSSNKRRNYFKRHFQQPTQTFEGSKGSFQKWKVLMKKTLAEESAFISVLWQITASTFDWIHLQISFVHFGDEMGAYTIPKNLNGMRASKYCPNETAFKRLKELLRFHEFATRAPGGLGTHGWWKPMVFGGSRELLRVPIMWETEGYTRPVHSADPWGCPCCRKT